MILGQYIVFLSSYRCDRQREGVVVRGGVGGKGVGGWGEGRRGGEHCL